MPDDSNTVPHVSNDWWPWTDYRPWPNRKLTICYRAAADEGTVSNNYVTVKNGIGGHMIMASNSAAMLDQGTSVDDVVVSYLCEAVYDCQLTNEVPFSNTSGMGDNCTRVNDVYDMHAGIFQVGIPLVTNMVVSNCNKKGIVFGCVDLAQISGRLSGRPRNVSFLAYSSMNPINSVVLGFTESTTDMACPPAPTIISFVLFILTLPVVLSGQGAYFLLFDFMRMSSTMMQ